jgi:hypothetical protein
MPDEFRQPRVDVKVVGRQAFSFDVGFQASHRASALLAISPRRE